MCAFECRCIYVCMLVCINVSMPKHAHARPPLRSHTHAHLYSHTTSCVTSMRACKYVTYQPTNQVCLPSSPEGRSHRRDRTAGATPADPQAQRPRSPQPIPPGPQHAFSQNRWPRRRLGEKSLRNSKIKVIFLRCDPAITDS